MKTPAQNNEEPDPLPAALRRDAARVQEPPFDPALHHATLRRIRAMADSGTARWSGWWKPALAGVAALAVLALCIGLWLPRTSQNIAQHAKPKPQPDFAAMMASTRTAVASLSADLSADPSSPLPAWMSPTASLLAPPYRPFININPQL